MLDSAWAYSLLGIGAVTSSTWLRSPEDFAKTSLANTNEEILAMIAQIGFALTILAFIRLPEFKVALAVLILTGVFMELNALATQTIRRKVCDKAEFPEFVGLEVVVGRANDGLISTIAGISIASRAFGYEAWFLVSATVLTVAGLSCSRFFIGRDLKSITSQS